MNCHQISEVLIGYLFDELPQAKRDAFEAHLQGCENCRQRMEELKKVHHRVGSAELGLDHCPHYDPKKYQKGVIHIEPRTRPRSTANFIFASVGRIAIIFIIVGIFAAIAVPDFNRARYQATSKTALAKMRVLEGQLAMEEMQSPPPTRGATPNDQPYDTTFFQNYGVNPFVSTEDEVFSTFGMDVDTASYTIARRFLKDGNIPDQDSVRTEEFINYFDQDYYDMEDAFSIHLEGALSEFGRPNYHLLRVGIKARDVNLVDRKAANMVFVVDISGSMDREDRLELVKRSLYLLAENLKDGDRIGLVVYGSQGRVISDLTSDRDKIYRVIGQLRPGGSTNAEEGLTLAYKMARKGFEEEKINRIILCSDGVANVGRTGSKSILSTIKDYAEEGITLTTLGFGMGNYNDVMMEQLANDGDGNYYYFDRLSEARRLFENGVSSMLQVIGSDAKIQVEFNADTVDRYRLLGYENRRLAADDFMDDSVDAGEVGAGQTVTALYELRIKDQALNDPNGFIGQVRIRYRNVDTRQVEHVERQVLARDINREFSQSNPRFRLTAAVAEFAEVLKKSYWAKDSSFGQVLTVAEDAIRDMRPGEEDLEFLRLVERAAGLSGEGRDNRFNGPQRLEGNHGGNGSNYDQDNGF